MLIGKDIHLKALSPEVSTRKEPILVQLTAASVALIFPYGALVFFNATSKMIFELIAHCQPHASQLFSTPETEQFTVIIRPEQAEGIVHNQVSIKQVTHEHLAIISDSLAKSTILEYHENRIGDLFEKIDPIAKSLKERGRLGSYSRQLLKYIGASLLIAQDMVGKVEVTEKPLLLWEHGELEHLHEQLVEDLEIIERQSNLERKIQLISHTAQVSLEVLQQHHSHRLEWYIIILIAIEIVLQLYDLFFT